MSRSDTPQILFASGSDKRPHACALEPEAEHLGEGCPRLDQCLARLSPEAPALLMRVTVRPDTTSFLPFISNGIKRLYRLSPDEVLNDSTPMLVRVHEQDFDRVLISLFQCVRTLEPWHQEYRVVLPPEGEERWLRGVIIPQRAQDGSTLGYGLIADITAHRHSQQEMADLCARAQIGIFRADAKGQLLTANMHFANICGYPSPEALLEAADRPDTRLGFDPEERQTFIKLIDRHGTVQDYTARLRIRDGGHRWLSLNARALRDAAGALNVYESYCADITADMEASRPGGALQLLGKARFGSLDEKKPAGDCSDGLCHVLSYVREVLLPLVRTPSMPAVRVG